MFQVPLCNPLFYFLNFQSFRLMSACSQFKTVIASYSKRSECSCISYVPTSVRDVEAEILTGKRTIPGSCASDILVAGQHNVPTCLITGGNAFDHSFLTSKVQANQTFAILGDSVVFTNEGGVKSKAPLCKSLENQFSGSIRSFSNWALILLLVSQNVFCI